MDPSEIPKRVIVAIEKLWPDGVVEQFSVDESYFEPIHARLEQQLISIRGASLQWQTQSDETAIWDGDNYNDLPPEQEFQSYHVFFLVPEGEEFHFEDETGGLEEPAEPQEEEWTETTHPGKCWIGYAVGISKAARFGVLRLSMYSQYEDGSEAYPDIEASHQDDFSTLSEQACKKLEKLRGEIAAVLKKNRIEVLDESILGLPVPGLGADGEVFLEEPVRVIDAFFFRGV